MVIHAPDFLEISIDELATLLAKDELQVTTEVKLFEAVLK